MTLHNKKLDALLARNAYVSTVSFLHHSPTPPINSKYQETYTPPRSMAAMRAASRPGPTIISCADPRVIPEEFMGLSRGGMCCTIFLTSHMDRAQLAETERTECAVIRNAGGRAANALPSLIILDSIVPMRTIVIIHHTGTPRFFCLSPCTVAMALTNVMVG